MLTRSPVPATRSPSASPKTFHAGTFHYVASSPHQSPRMSTAVSRRQSTSSPSGRPVSSPLASQSQSAGKKYVSKSTQYSPMEHTDYSVPRPRPVQHSPLTAPSQPSSTPCPKPTSSADQATTAPTQPTAPASSAERAPIIPVAYPQSPNKRRNSQGPGSSVDEGSVVGQGTEALAKRPKADAAPPKLLPQKYELCATDDIVVLIANMISELIETNDALAMKSGHLTRFHSRTAPGISVLDYLHRLAKHATLSPPLLLSMVYYIDRLCALYPDFTINTLTVHRFLITAATVAAKGLSDSFWNNSTYARVGGVRTAELKLLELEFLYRVDWKIVPNPEVLVAYYRGLVERSPAYVLEDETPTLDEDTEISDEMDEEGEEADDEDEEISRPPERT